MYIEHEAISQRHYPRVCWEFVVILVNSDFKFSIDDVSFQSVKVSGGKMLFDFKK